jgi:hypothetical protein
MIHTCTVVKTTGGGVGGVLEVFEGVHGAVKNLEGP